MIGISLLTLVPGALGGSESYVRGLLRTLATEGALEYRVVAPPVAPHSGEGLPTVVAREYRPARTIPHRLAAMALAAARPGPLRRHLDGADAVHFPLTIALPRPAQPFAVTLHDLQHLDLPDLFPRAERAFRALAWHRSVRSARAVIVPSAFVRDRAVERLGLDVQRVHVIPHGLDHERLRPREEPESREPLLLYPARAWPHKNHERLLEAFALLRRERPALRLVLTGGGHARTRAGEGVEVLGHVSQEELLSLYRRAGCLVFPSLYEGFGQPPLEAMACGCPVSAARAGALPEVCGDAARLFDPLDPSAIAAAVRDVLDDPQPWRERGLERARGFTWDRCARAHEDVYRRLIEGRGPSDVVRPAA